MGLEVFYPEDIRNALLAAEQTANATAQVLGQDNNPFADCFLAGHQAALTAIALAFGLVSGDNGRQLEWPGLLALGRGR